jgi:hypothetical protein
VKPKNTPSQPPFSLLVFRKTRERDMFSRRKLFMAGGAMAAVSAAAVVRSKNRADIQLEPASDTTKKRPNTLFIMTKSNTLFNS